MVTIVMFLPEGAGSVQFTSGNAFIIAALFYQFAQETVNLLGFFDILQLMSMMTLIGAIQDDTAYAGQLLAEGTDQFQI